jgi:stage V sporulation protein AD
LTVRRGDTLVFETPPVIGAWASAGGKKEGEGPLGAAFDERYADNTLGKASWEQAESALLGRCAARCLEKGGTSPAQVSLALSGDLQAQCTASGYAMRGLDIPFAGVYGACSTMAETLGLAACLCGAGLADQVLAMAGSHFCAAERQFRTPLEYGGKRTPTAQWTATAAGACLVRPVGAGVRITAVTFGRVRDLGAADINNMGAAMAPAAAATLLRFLRDTGTAPAHYDAILTGDLGRVGSELLGTLMRQEGVPLPNHADCGCVLYDPAQRVKAGGSGPGCCAAVLCAHILPRLQSRSWRRVLFIATGALMSQTTVLQRETIPAVAHLVFLEAPGADD